MKKRNHFLTGSALGAATLLAACGGGAGGGNVAMEPGEWETTVEVTKMDVSNLPPEMREEINRRPPARSGRTRSCWTMSADVVRIENLRFTIPMPFRFEPNRPTPGCHVAELVMEGGTLRSRMSCTGLPGPGPRMDAVGTMTMSGEMNGTYTANSVQATATGEIRFGERSGSGEVRLTSRRLGACPPPPVYRPPPVYAPDMGEGNMLAPVPMVPAPMPMPVPRAVPVPPAPPRISPGNKM